jgi:carboxylesterase type B
VSAVPIAWALNITGNLIVNYGESLTAGLVAQNSDEDCLSLAVWTPAWATKESKLPVVVYLTGGGDVTGGINIPTQLPANWVHRTQNHIVVTTNYRVNIFGYPNARALGDNANFALQDQRMAVEWVQENIASFGGDPSQITLTCTSSLGTRTRSSELRYPARASRLGGPTMRTPQAATSLSWPKRWAVISATPSSSWTV